MQGEDDSTPLAGSLHPAAVSPLSQQPGCAAGALESRVETWHLGKWGGAVAVILGTRGAVGVQASSSMPRSGMLVGGSGSRAQPCSSSKKQSHSNSESRWAWAWVRICRLAQQSLVLCDPKEQSIETGSSVSWRLTCSPGGKAAKQPVAPRRHHGSGVPALPGEGLGCG